MESEHILVVINHHCEQADHIPGRENNGTASARTGFKGTG